jgi:photosystem II stability/assembly factor-like uncharacterized protein
MRSLAAQTIPPWLVAVALLSVLLWLVGLHGAEAGINTWTAHGPGGATLHALAIDPQSPTTIYAAGAWGRGVFKSIDGGGRWSAFNTGLTDGYVNALAIDPQTPTTVYAGTSGGVFKSTDGGVTWRALNYPSLPTYTAAYSLAIHPQISTTLYAGTQYGVFKSADGGATWSAVNTGLPPWS